MHVTDENLTAILSKDITGGPLLGAVYARVDTVVGFTRMFTPLGKFLIARPAARAKAHGISDDTGVPLDAGMVLGVTVDELHVWSADMTLSQVRDHLGAISRTRIVSVDVGADKTWQPLIFTLTDGHRIEVKARGGVRQFVDAFV